MPDQPGTLPAALVRFQERLEQAHKAATIDPSELPAGSNPARLAQAVWIKAAQHLMEENGLSRFADLPLAMLMALGNLDRGQTPPMLAASAEDTQRVLMEDARTMARAAKLLDLLSDPAHPNRQSRTEAARTVFSALPRPGPFKTPSAILELRKNISRGRGVPKDVMRLWRQPLPPEAGTTPADRARWLLEMLPER